jgi:hypothetical protein
VGIWVTAAQVLSKSWIGFAISGGRACLEIPREALGEERLAWLSGLPLIQVHGPVALVHASPESCWRSPAHTAGDEALVTVYKSLGRPIAVYGHIHVPYDGDRRASYLLVDDSNPTIRRVEYEIEEERKAIADFSLPRRLGCGDAHDRPPRSAGLEAAD